LFNTLVKASNTSLALSEVGNILPPLSAFVSTFSSFKRVIISWLLKFLNALY